MNFVYCGFALIACVLFTVCLLFYLFAGFGWFVLCWFQVCLLLLVFVCLRYDWLLCGSVMLGVSFA